MDTIGLAFSVFTLLVAVVGIAIAVAQLRSGRRDAHAARMADLAWQIYQTYEDDSLRRARKAIEVVSNRVPIPLTGEEYGKMYVTESTAQQQLLITDINESPTVAVRRMLRFYHQIGILLNKGLVDDDFIFALIGPGLVTSKHGIKVASDRYQNYWAGSTGHEKGAYRPIYANALKLCEAYDKWSHEYELMT